MEIINAEKERERERETFQNKGNSGAPHQKKLINITI